MSYASQYPVRCTHPGCTAQHPSSKWGDIRAADAGWYHAKDDTAYCPDHVPGWVREWRAKQAPNRKSPRHPG